MIRRIHKGTTINISKNTHSTMYIYILLLISFFLSNFYRISTSVILPDLAIEWGISSTTTGMISAIFFYTYAVAQPFCGVLNENIGPIKVVFSGITLTAIGTVFMCAAQSAVLFSIGRFFTGLGLAPMLSAALVFQANCLPIARYVTFTGITFAVGNIGTIASVGPLNYLVNRFSFSFVYVGLAVICILIGVQLLLNSSSYNWSNVIKQGLRNQSFGAQLAISFGYIFRCRQLKAMLLVWMVVCGSLVCFQGLWAVQWYHIAFDVPFTSASNWATLIGAGVAFGNFAGGQISKIIKSRRTVIIFFSIAFTVSWSAEWLLLKYHWSLMAVGITGFILGTCAGVEYTQLTTGVYDIAEKGQGAVIFGIMNSFVFLSVAFFQYVSGLLIDIFSEYQRNLFNGFSSAFAVIIAIVIIGQLSLFFLSNFNRIDVK